MSKLRKVIQTMVLVSLFSAVLAPAVWARTVISSFGVHVKTNLEAGSTLPEMSVGNNGDTNYVYTSSSKYDVVDVQWSTSTDKTLKIGETPKLKIYLEAVDDYYFRSSYSSNNVSVSGADFVSAKTNGGHMVVTVNARPVKGEFDPPGRRLLGRFQRPGQMGSAGRAGMHPPEHMTFTYIGAAVWLRN